jgi:large subunit ribosomal protein L25
VEVRVENKKIPCLIHAVSFDPVTDREEHVDFYAVDMTKKVTTKVPVVVTGESPAVKTEGGVLVTVHDQIEVTCLPSDIPKEFIVDIAALVKFHDSITVASLKGAKGVTVKSPADMVIITVQEPRKEEVIEVAAPVAAEGEAAAAPTAAPGAEGAAAPAAGTKPDDDKAAAGKEKTPAKK